MSDEEPTVERLVLAEWVVKLLELAEEISKREDGLPNVVVPKSFVINLVNDIYSSLMWQYRQWVLFKSAANAKERRRVVAESENLLDIMGVLDMPKYIPLVQDPRNVKTQEEK